jgi:hypothetical protein
MTSFRLHNKQTGKQIKENRLGFHFSFEIAAFILLKIAAYIYIQKTELMENGNFLLFAAN